MSVDMHLAPGFRVDVRVHLDESRIRRAPELVGSLERSQRDLVSGPVAAERPSDEEARARRDFALLDGGVTFDQLAAQLKSKANDGDAAAKLEALLRRHPADVARAIGLARDEARVDDRVRTVMAALGAAGTPETQAALCALVGDPKARVELRTEAVKALIRTTHPTHATVSSILAAIDDPSDSEIRRHALYVLGAIGHVTAVTAPSDGSMIESQLLERFARCSGQACGDLMIALGNLATPKTLPAIEETLRSTDVSLCVKAARALSLIADAAADRLIVASLSDGAAEVRSAAILAARSRPVAPLIEALAKTAQSDSTEYVRRDAIIAIADHLKASPRFEEVLEAAATKDPSPSNRRLARAAIAGHAGHRLRATEGKAPG